MYTGLLHAHSGFRWLVVLFLVIVIIKAFSGWFGKKEYGKADNLIAILLLSFTHLQFVIGLAIYFIGGKLASIAEAMKVPEARFWAVEHGVTMILAIVLITLGRVKSKKASTDELKHKKGAIYYTIALILILWGGVIKPFAMGRGWF